MADNNIAPTRYGKRKMNKDAYVAQSTKKKATSGGKVYGRRKGNPESPEAQDEVNPFLSQADSNSNGRVTIAEARALLEKAPSLIDDAIAAEFADGKPRKGAIELFVEIETSRPEPRADILELLGALAPIKGDSDGGNPDTPPSTPPE